MDSLPWGPRTWGELEIDREEQTHRSTVSSTSWFASLSKFNLETHEFFDSRVFHSSPPFHDFLLHFVSPNQLSEKEN
jgi:hypothetical protein